MGSLAEVGKLLGFFFSLSLNLSFLDLVQILIDDIKCHIRSV